MKKLFLSALAATMMTAPMSMAQAAPRVPVVQSDAVIQQVQYRPNQKTVKRTVIKRDHRGRVVEKRVVRKNWQRGNRVPSWQRYQQVDHKRYHLRQPARGQRWVRVDNDFLLISIGSGIVASIIAGR